MDIKKQFLDTCNVARKAHHTIQIAFYTILKKSKEKLKHIIFVMILSL